MKKIIAGFKLMALLSFTLLVSGAGAAVLSYGIGLPEITPYVATGLMLTACMSYSGMNLMPGMLKSDPIVFDQGICAAIQTSLNDMMGPESPEKRRTPVGYLQAITSPANMADMELKQLDPGNGKKKKVNITYAQRGTEDQVQDTYNNGCSADFSDKPFDEDVEITRVRSLKGMTFSENEMRKLCEADTEWIARRINAYLDPFMTGLNKILIALQNTNFGNFKDGTSVVHSRQLLNTVSAFNKYPNIFGENMIRNDFQDIGYSATDSMLIGGGILRDYTNLQGIGCCNSVGLDNGQGAAYNYYYDEHVGSVLGNANDFIGLVPGAVQLLTYNKYKGDYVKDNDSFKKTTIIDPFTGLELDIRWKYDDCEEEWILTFSLWYELFFMPTNAYKSNDPLYGVNDTLHYRATEANV